MDKKEIQNYINTFKNNEAEWISSLWKLCEAELKRTIKKSSITISEDNYNIGISNFFFLVYKQIFSTSLIDNPYLTISPRITKENLFKKFEGNRKVRLKKSVVNDLIESFLSTIKFIFGGDTTVIEKRELKKLQDRYDEISGQKISKKNIIHYKEIVKRREELKKEGKEGHQISWLKVTQEYRKSNKKILDWGDRKTKTISESIRKLHKAGKI